MEKITKSIISVALCLTIGNFIYQALGPRNWSAAVERSWFQVWALFCLWGWIKINK